MHVNGLQEWQYLHKLHEWFPPVPAAGEEAFPELVEVLPPLPDAELELAAERTSQN